MADPIIFTPEELATEIWKPVPDWPKYHVSSLGRLRYFHSGQIKMAVIKRLSRHGNYYSVRLRNSTKEKWKNILLHKVIQLAFFPDHTGLMDHIDGNKLNNRVKNLRPATESQNRWNIPKTLKPRSSKYKGVYWSKEKCKWLADLSFLGNRVRLGAFKNEEEAGLAYNDAAKKYHGEFAKLNDL